jgi:hypothetical protein
MTQPTRKGRRRRLPPKPPEPPPGHMWWFWELVPIAEVEQRAKRVMRRFDRLPRKVRDNVNNGGD